MNRPKGHGGAPFLAAGRRLGRYEICAELASGGMGTVYLARATGPAGFDKLVALKVVHPRLARERGFIEMFLDEARIASRITHPNVGSVFDVGEDEGTYYLAMDYLHGEALSTVLKGVTRNPTARASHLYPIHVMAIVAAACEGLHAAHELRGDDGAPLDVVHRDISPHNIFVTYDGGVRVVDFGIARAAGQLHKTLSGTVRGKTAYMAPEQLKGDDLDRRADIWAIGVTLWELLTCRRLFRRTSDGQTLQAVLSGPIPAPSTFAPHLPEGVDDVVAAMLSRAPEGRPYSAREVGRSLRRAIASTGEVMSTAELAEWMQELFAEHSEAKRRMIERARRGEAVVQDVADTQRFKLFLADSVPTVVGEHTDVHATARPGMETLPDGGMGAVPIDAPAEASTVVTKARITIAPKDDVAHPHSHPPEAAATASDAEVAIAPAERGNVGGAPAPERPKHQTDSVNLPTHGIRRLAMVGALGLAALALVAGVFAVSTLHSGGEEAALPRGPEPAPNEVADEPIEAPVGAIEEPSIEGNPETPVEDDAAGSPVEGSTGPEAPSLEPPEADPASQPEPEPQPRRERPAEDTERSPVPTGRGRLSIGVRGGWGTFVVDGTHRGDTPREIALPAGRHRVVIRPFGDGVPIRRTVTVRPGQTARVTVDAPQSR